MFSFIYEIELVFLFEIQNKDGDSQSSQSVCVLPTCQRARLWQKKLQPLHGPGSLEEWHLEAQTVCCSTCHDKGISPDPETFVATDQSQGQMPMLYRSLLVEDEKSNETQHHGA